MIREDLIQATREDLTQKIAVYCNCLENERLRRVAKLAYEEVQHQQRAIAMQTQIDPMWATATATAEVRAAPETVVYAPELKQPDTA